MFKCESCEEEFQNRGMLQQLGDMLVCAYCIKYSDESVRAPQ